MKIIPIKTYIVYFVIILFVINELLGIQIFSEFTIVQQGFKVILFSIYIIVFLKSFNSWSVHNSKFHISIILFISMLIFYGLFSKYNEMLFPCLNVFLIYFFFYYFSEQGILNNKKMKVLFILYLIVSFILYNEKMKIVLDFYGSIENIQGVNVGYVMLNAMMLSFLFYKKHYFNYLLTIILFVFILFTFKRGAVICGAIIIVFSTYTFFKLMIKRNKKSLLLLIIPAISILLFFVIDNQSLLFRRFNADALGDSSGRGIVYSTILDDYSNASLFQLIFGKGFFSTSDMSFEGVVYGKGYYAHSDYYELMADHGLIGMLLYLILIFSFLFSIKDQKNILYKMILYSLFFVWITKAYFSGVYTTLNSQIMFAIIGFINGNTIFLERKMMDLNNPTNLKSINN